MRLEKPIACRNCLNKIHENHLSVSSLYPKNSVRLNYFLATSAYFSEIEGFDFDIALKLRPYAGIIGIDNSSVDKYLKISKVLRLHANLLDAGGFIYEIYNQGPRYSYLLPWKSSNCFWRTFVRNIVLLIYKGFSSFNFSFIGMMSSKTVLLDVEGFRHRKEKFIVKELGVCTDAYLDCVSFLPPTSYFELTTQQKQSFGWLTRNLHGIEWDTGNFPYIYLTQIIQSVRLRNPGAIF